MASAGDAENDSERPWFHARVLIGYPTVRRMMRIGLGYSGGLCRHRRWCLGRDTRPRWTEYAADAGRSSSAPARRHLMTSEPVRDPLADRLLTPENCMLIIIDYQPTQIGSIKSMDQDLLVDRVVHLARFAMLYR